MPTIVSPTQNNLTLPASRVTEISLLAPSDVQYYFLHDNGTGVYTDYTTEANEDTADDVPLLPPAPIQGSDEHFVGSLSKIKAVIYTVSTAGAGTYNAGFSYWHGTNWRTLPAYFGTEADLNDFRTAQESCLILLPPTDQAKNTVNSVSAYWIRYRVVAPGGGYGQPLAARIRITPGSFAGQVMKSMRG